MANIEEFMRKSDRMEVSRFLSTEAGSRLMAYLRRAYTRRRDKTDDSLIRNAIGFDAHHECCDLVEKAGEIPAKPDKEENDSLEP